MGYRSDVRIVVSKKGYDELKKYVDKYLADNKKDFSLLTDPDLFKQNKYSTYLGWNSVKWYEGSYKDVDSIMEGLNHLKEKDMSYRYARLGESYDDYEEMDYESDNEVEQDLEYPSMLREFDDEYISQEFDIQDNLTSNEVEI